ncbi:hypothetical protein [Paenibacillus sp. FSL L8-0638]|uniref:hypothetical protein n=1 Tax=Paenibacillus TaxID=44249 RepID=UPI0031595B74
MTTTYWDEIFLDQFNERKLQEQLQAAGEEDWMLLSVDECIKGISQGSLVLHNDQKIPIQARAAFADQMTFPLPYSFTETTGFDKQGGRNPHRVIYRDQAQGVSLGLHWREEPLHQEQVLWMQQQLAHRAKKLQPDMQLIEENLLELEQGLIACYEALFIVDPHPYYQIVFVRSWQGRAFTGSIQFKLEDAPLWHPLSYAIIRLIHFVEHNHEMS